MSDQRKTLLIVSVSDINADARVRKQVMLFSQTYRVVTCGLGEAVRDDVEHIPLTLPQGKIWPLVQSVLLRTRQFRLIHKLHPLHRSLKQKLRGNAYDAVLLNDLDPLGVVVEAFPSTPVHADLHEYFPGLLDHLPSWVKLRKPFVEWSLRRFLPSVSSATTVSDTIAARYSNEYGVHFGVVRNAAPWQPLMPQPITSPLRIVHAGGAQRNRRLETMIEAVRKTQTQVIFDLYLVGGDDEYIEELKAIGSSGTGNLVVVHPPVPQSSLVETLNSYDLGIHILPPTNTNNSLALPNKFFDYLQARLGMVLGPTPDMVALLTANELGVVAGGFEVQDIVTVLDGISHEQVAQWKTNANQAARRLNAEGEETVWVQAVASLFEDRG